MKKKLSAVGNSYGLEDVLELHEMQLELYGGATGIRESNLHESAVMMPQTSFGGQFIHDGVFRLASD